MTLAVAHPETADYFAPMARLIAKLLLLFAVLLMPFGMAAAPANAPHHAIMTDMPAGHCQDQGSGGQPRGAIGECTMACAASLPAVEAPAGQPPLIVCQPLLPSRAHRLIGIHPDTATPPPKGS